MKPLSLLIVLLMSSVTLAQEPPEPPETGEPGFVEITQDQGAYSWSLHTHHPEPDEGSYYVEWLVYDLCSGEGFDDDSRIVPSTGLFLSGIPIVHIAPESVYVEAWLMLSVAGGPAVEVEGTRTTELIYDDSE